MNKVGRNDPCPCGSGKKFKKCCLDKPYQPSAELLADFELGQQRIREYEEEQKKREQDLSKPVEPLPVTNSGLPLFTDFETKKIIHLIYESS